MLLIDAFFRFSGIAMLMMIAIITYRDNRNWHGSRFLILACISVTGLFLGYTIDVLRLPSALHTAARIVDVPHLVFVWLFAQALFLKTFRLTQWHWIVSAAYLGPIFWIRFAGLELLPQYPNWLLTYVSATSFLLAAHLIFVIVSDWRDDLQDARRKSRLYFVLLLVVVVGFAALAEPVVGRESWINLRTFTILSIWPAIAAGAYWLLRADKNALLFHANWKPEEALSGRDRELSAKLMTALREREVFRQAGLNIVQLASDLGVTQHRLRALINQELGFRNFSTFLNGYRLDAVIEALRDETKKHLPIQTIAMDCGFQSMAPFNRAFRERTGQSPSEYRDSGQIA